MATKRKENADRMKALAEEYRKGKKSDGNKKAKKTKKSDFEKVDKDGDGKISEKEWKDSKKKKVVKKD